MWSHPDMSERRWQEYVLDTFDNFKDKYRKVELQERAPFHRKYRKGVGRPRLSAVPSEFYRVFVADTYGGPEDGLKVLISGEGADKLSLGYRWFFSSQPSSEFLEYSPLADIQAVLRAPAAVTDADLGNISVGDISENISAVAAEAGFDGNSKLD